MLKIEKWFDEGKVIQLEIYDSKAGDAGRVIDGILKGIDREVLQDFSVSMVKKGKSSIDIVLLISGINELAKEAVHILLTNLDTKPSRPLPEWFRGGVESLSMALVIEALKPILRAIRSFIRGGSKKLVIDNKQITRDMIPQELRDELIDKGEKEWLRFGE